ncbi:MAG: IS5 family transposase [Acetobacteraceae bacterium]|nr:IS5 family transposase [Acetobacteraceae bacterium]
MRGSDEQTGALFSYVSCESRVPPDHPLRLIRAVVDEALDVLSPEFDRLYARVGRPGIAPEKLLRALLLQAFYSIRSERQLMEQLDYNLLFRWFVGLAMDAPVWDASTFSKNRDRLLDGDVAQKLLAAVVAQPRVRGLMSDAHFSVDGTLIQAWASHKSFQPKPQGGDGPPAAPPSGPTQPGRNAERDWRGQKRSNETHRSITDPDARLARKSDGQSSILAYAGHVLMENRSGLVAQSCLTHATGTAEREAGLALLDCLPPNRRITLGADKGYDVASFVAGLRERQVTPHIAIDNRLSRLGKIRATAIDGRTTRHPGYALSQRARKRIEEVFGWIKGSAGLRQAKHRGRERVAWRFDLTAAAYNLIRLPKLLVTAAG